MAIVEEDFYGIGAHLLKILDVDTFLPHLELGLVRSVAAHLRRG
jgi:hypothetical protein